MRRRTSRHVCRASPSRTRWSSPRARESCSASCSSWRDLGAKSSRASLSRRAAWAALRPSAVESRFEALRTRNDTAGRPRRGDRAAAAALGAGKARRRLRGADLGRTRHRQVAHRSDYRGTAQRRAAHAVTLFLLAASPGQRTLSKHRPARAGGRLPARGYAPSSGSPSWRQFWPKGPMISVRPFLCWRTCCRSRRATAIRRSISLHRSARRRRFMRCWRRSRDWRRVYRY